MPGPLSSRRASVSSISARRRSISSRSCGPGLSWSRSNSRCFRAPGELREARHRTILGGQTRRLRKILVSAHRFFCCNRCLRNFREVRMPGISHEFPKCAPGEMDEARVIAALKINLRLAGQAVVDYNLKPIGGRKRGHCARFAIIKSDSICSSLAISTSVPSCLRS